MKDCILYVLLGQNGEASVSVVRCYHQAQRSLAKPPIRPDRALNPVGQAAGAKKTRRAVPDLYPY